MASTLKQSEDFPAVYVNEGAAWAWQRIESYIAHRFEARQVVWIVKGCGEWEIPLTPATVTKAEVWNNGVWESVTLPDTALGGYWLGDATYRFTANVGSGDCPAKVLEAVLRLENYMTSQADNDVPQGLSSYSVNMDEVSENFSMEKNANAMALQNSGAADLLRNYRRV